MRRLNLLPVVVACFCLITTVAMNAVFAQRSGPGPAQPPTVPKSDCANRPYWGTVTEVTKDSITIQWTATPGEKPKTFSVSETLAAGKVPKEPRLMPDSRGLHGYSLSPSNMYRLTDVKVGDWVAIHYAHLGDQDICDHICIQKRPGGRMPPLPDEAEALLRPPPPRPDRPEPPYIPYHEYWDAYWDLEDKGIPYPEKFGIHRRFSKAPMPREKGALPAKIMQ